MGSIPINPRENDWKYVPSRNKTPAYSVFSLPIQQSQQDDRQYRLIRLANGLRALLIHDPTADKAAAALDVSVGHLNDPDDMPGLAHFCEHLLFMGTEEYPSENEYSNFIASNGGSTNAYTAPSNTNYYFSVSSSHLHGALQRFAGFFHSPLFDPSCTARELNAVDSEHKKNLQSDGWRIFQLGKSLSKEGHKWRKFGSGNRESLLAAGRALSLPPAPALNKDDEVQSKDFLTATSATSSRVPSPAPSASSSSSLSDMEPDGGPAGRETRRRLVEWWESEYCAGRMKLAILGRDSLDALTDMAVELFTPVQNRGKDPSPMIRDSPLGPDEMGTIVFVKTVMDFRSLEICFPLEFQDPLYRSKPGSFIAHFIGHEGPGSLFSYLKRQGWAVGLSAGSTELGRGFDILRLNITLTPEGFASYRLVLNAAYKYLTLLRTAPFPAFYFTEQQKLSEMRFRFSEKRPADSYVSSLAAAMQKSYAPEHLLAGSKLLWDWREDEVRKALQNLTVHTGRVMLMGKSHDEIGLSNNWLKERWYKTEYQVQRLDSEVVEEAQILNDVPDLHLPGPNEFFPDNLEVEKLDVSEPLKRPLLIQESSLLAVWFKKDDQFWVPKANVLVDIQSPLASVTPRHAVLTRLIGELVTDALQEYSYDADLAGLKYSFSGYSHGFQLSLSGYNSKLSVLLEKILDTFRSLTVDPVRLSVIREQLKLEYENFKLDQPYNVGMFWMRYTLQERAWTPEEKLTELHLIEENEIQNFLNEILHRVFIKVLVHGNVLKSDALQVARKIENILQPRPLTPTEIGLERSLILNTGSNHVWSTAVPNESDVNSSLVYYCHVGDIKDESLRPLLSLLAHIIREPCFNQLRTKEQLGYIVSSSQVQSTGSMGLRIVVQSERDPSYLEGRVEAFFDDFRDILAEMPDEVFRGLKDGLITKKLEKLKNLNEEANRFWTHLTSGYNDFFRAANDAKALQDISKANILDHFMKFVHPSSTSRRKFSIHCRAQKAQSVKFTSLAAGEYLKRLKAAGFPVDEQLYLQLSAAEPPLDAVKTFWLNAFSEQPGFGSSSTAQELLRSLDDLAQEFPSSDPVSDTAVELHPRNTLISDLVSFKRSLHISTAATPVADFHDLSVSKF
ncbi:insulin-degrading enzyme [Sistotremastrum niveocremeum HHB9708]|uniref:Insulin-degrading enzyme n=1 Tax=Sistotremastrum niveocremeum HHB9708 TaxID=1314777 RepID=A0A164QWV9_9AGAM|nr:insulin-degrading enzyme [Sistotremastrum niveocremeum HHB9708]